MLSNKKIFLLLLITAAIFFCPYFASYLQYGGKFPDDKFNFPPLTPIAKPGFNWVIAIGAALLFAGLLLLFLFPRLFGFKRTDDEEKIPLTEKIKLPVWFWAGLVIWGLPLLVLSAHWSSPKWLINWAIVPLCWGFTLLLDGLVYIRNNKRSMVSTAPGELIAIGVISISGWLVFEYLNFFVNINWYYPKATLIKHDEFLLYAVIGSSGLMPMAFEWYDLLRTFKRFRNRYRLGPVVILSRTVKAVLFVLSFAGLFAAAYLPNNLFYILWVAPLIILTVALEKLGVWTPFAPVKNGNWSPLVLFALTYLVQGFLLEWWNYASGTRVNGALFTHNPAYWVYSVPYVDAVPVFEMPILGYLGYVPFSVYCWIWWIATSSLLNISKAYTFSTGFRGI